MKNSGCCGLKKPLIGIGTKRGYISGSQEKFFSAFTLAEMMVVMLIMSIILAAMAPVMTTRSKADSSSPWRYSPNNSSDAYFGTGNAQVAMIGQPNKLEADDAARLIINSTVALPFQISFKRDNANVGHLQMLDSNIVLGDGDLASNTGTRISSFGIESMKANTTGSDNTALGAQTLTYNTTGSQNTAVGQASLMNNVSGTGNNALGTSSLRSNTSGQGNTAVGQDTLYNNNGNYNTAIGWYSSNSNTSGINNTALGADSLKANTAGSYNTAVGYSALKSSSGYYNVAVGYSANSETTSLDNTVAIGAFSYSTGHDALAVGTNAQASAEGAVSIGGGRERVTAAVASDAFAVAIGSNAKATTDYSVAVGYGSKAEGDGSGTALGGNAYATNFFTTAVGRTSNASGYYSTSIGGNSDATAQNTVALGYSSEASNSYATALGYDATASGLDATAVGALSTAKYTTSVALGYKANAANTDAVAIGNNVKASGESGIAIGSAGDTNNTTASGSRAVAIGDGAVASGDHSVALGRKSIARGTKNIAIGDNACSNVAGSNKICIGANSGPTSGNWVSTIDNEERIFIGSKSKFNNQPAVLEVHNTSEKIPSSTWVYGGMNGSGVVINGSLIVKGPIFSASRDNNTGSWNHTYSTEIGVFEHYGSEPNNGVGDHYLVKRLTNDSLPKTWHPLIKYSDRRLKYIGNEFTSGLDKIKELKVYNYTFKKDKSKTPHIGVIAQDLQKVFPDAVKKGADGFLTIRMEDMFYAMINAIKELDLKYQAQEKRINELEKRIEKLEAKIK